MSPAYKFVMLIDEDEIDNIINQKIIESNKFSERVMVFQTGTDALDFLRNNSKVAENLPDLIFLDLNMPRMNGKQCLTQIKANGKFRRVPVVVYSTSAEKNEMEEMQGGRVNTDKMYDNVMNKYLWGGMDKKGIN